MQIQPVQPVLVNLKSDDYRMACNLIELNNDEMYLSTDEFLEKNAEVSFQSPFFWGQGVVISVNYVQVHFRLTLRVSNIKFQPGLLVNMKL